MSRRARRGDEGLDVRERPAFQHVEARLPQHADPLRMRRDREGDARVTRNRFGSVKGIEQVFRFPNIND